AGDDVNDWLSLVGYILSPSDFESFHMAIGEGLLTGCQPVIWPWEGAGDLWGNEHVVTDTDSACRLVLEADLDKPKTLPEHMNPEAVIASWADQFVPERTTAISASGQPQKVT